MACWILMALFAFDVAFADAGKIMKLTGGDDAYVIRQGEKFQLTLDASLEVGDEIHSASSHLVMLIFPDTQLSLPRQSELKVIEATVEETPEKSRSLSVVELIKGQVRSLVTKEQNHEVEHTIKVTNAAFAVRGTEFEVGIDGDDVDLDVEEGEVEFSSPLVQTFVPEIIKRNEGFRFSRKNKKFMRRKFSAKLKNPGFLGRDALKEQFRAWKAKRSALREIRRENRANRKSVREKNPRRRGQ